MDLKRIAISENSKRYRGIHAEVPGAIVNIYTGSQNSDGQGVTRVEIIADDYRGEEWRVRDNSRLHKALSVPVIQMKQPFYCAGNLSRTRECLVITLVFDGKTPTIYPERGGKITNPTASTMARIMALAANPDYQMIFSPGITSKADYSVKVQRRYEAEDPRARFTW